MAERTGDFAMADVSGKAVTTRRALAMGRIVLGPHAYEPVVSRTLPKGDALTLAEIAGIQGAKQTPSLIPLCHPINLNRVIVRHRAMPDELAVGIYCLAEIAERTGVEMEALTGASVALLTVWDLAKPLEPALGIEAVTLRYKSGGKSGEWIHPDGLDDFAQQMLEQAK
ncbi:MAG: cyclic pyranopterin monophosphate synthase MoaC [Pseudomonadota bacterium]